MRRIPYSEALAIELGAEIAPNLEGPAVSMRVLSSSLSPAAQRSSGSIRYHLNRK